MINGSYETINSVLDNQKKKTTENSLPKTLSKFMYYFMPKVMERGREFRF